MTKMLRAITLTLALISLLTTANAAPAPLPALKAAITLTDAGANSGVKDELQQEICFGLIRRGEFAEAQSRAAKLPAYQHAAVLLELATRLPASQQAEAEKLLANAQHDRELTVDWHKSRVSRWLAVAQAKRGQSQTAAKTAREVPDAEDRAFALRDVVLEFCRQGEVMQARELADAIEENRRYGTYRQKAEALAQVATALHGRGDNEGAATLLAQAALLLPKKPGWSDGGAMRGVAAAQYACGETASATALLNRADDLASAIAGPWKVSEFTQISAAWRRCGESVRADQRLAEAAIFLTTLTVTDRIPEALTLARAQFATGQKVTARKLLAATLAEAVGLASPEVARAHHVSTLLAWAELFSTEPLPTE